MTKIVSIEGVDDIGRAKGRNGSSQPTKKAVRQEKKAVKKPVRRPPPPPPVEEEVFETEATQEDSEAVLETLGCSHMPAKKMFTLADHDPSNITEGHMDLLIARDNMVTKRDIVRNIQGIGSIKSEKFNNSIDVLNDALHAINTEFDATPTMGLIEEDILSGIYSNHSEMSGIGDVDEIGKARSKKTKTREAARKGKTKKEFTKAKTKTGKFLKRASEKTKKGLKAFAKVATAPQRAAVKLILEIMLPQASIFFLYLFINDPKIIASLPETVKNKRRTAERVKNFIVNVIGMKEAHFMGIIRNGIMKKLGASPETILSRSMKGVQGIGFIDLAVKAVPIIINIVKKLIVVFKKKKAGGLDIKKNDAPNPDKDFGGLSEQEKTNLSTSIKQQNDLPEPTEERTVRPRKKINTPNADDTASENSESKGSTDTATSESKASLTDNSDTDANGEIKNDAGKKEFATGGRKEWNSLGK